ncbi:hypothetical protein [Marinomonas aquiplantarum]|uniref:Uncharacterized protein n=1 Tax=Marinomonas aquiplantarum TaxID=491951 RepID=A0A366D8S5_9GAMM|nr:hypothetical protein [Marinomonas aquiplantarum]RBO85899.1 hypothetical protein DFP76_101174 [Marinomonas aquiplantarum]
MKYDFQLTINGERVPLVSHDICLDDSRPGRASFVVQSDTALSGLVYFSFSINGKQQHGHFYGYVENSVAASQSTQSLFCREKSNLLEMSVPMALRHATLADVLNAVKEQTGLDFTWAKQASYSQQQVAHFVNTGSGFHLLNSLAKVFAIPDFTWMQKRDGSVFVGAWQDGHWSNSPISVPYDILDKQLATKSAELLAIPGLRAGYQINGKRLHQVRLIDSKMVISWKKP